MPKFSFALFKVLFLFLLLVVFPAAKALDKAAEDKAKQIWQMLDYIAVDYAGAVKNGAVVSKDEYAEMQEFSQNVAAQIKELPETGSKQNLLNASDALRNAIANKETGEAVADRARSLASALIAVYPIPAAPSSPPDLKLGAKIYQAQCVRCHGSEGKADTPLAATLNPPPIAFTDHARARERSVLSLYQTTTRGVQGTSMPAFASLSDDERWALAYFVSTMAYSDEDRARGADLWKSDPAAKSNIEGIGTLTGFSEADLAKKMDSASARSVLAYLRSNPQLVSVDQNDSLALARTRLKESLVALEKGEKTEAGKLAISAYLDGFEPVEPALAAKNNALFIKIEKTMGMYRAAVNEGRLDAARDTEAQLQSLLGEAKESLGTNQDDPLAAFLGAFMILVREGLEALLIVVAMIAFLKKADRTEALPYVHAGWVGALAAGGLTWAAATYLIDISGASRELTEGFAALFAAAVLLFVGVWMHQKSLAGRWQAYIREKLTHALSKRSVFFLFILSFVTVYREVFETVLFYAALWNDRNGLYLMLGLAGGVAVLAVIALLMLRTTKRLPIGKFFAASSALVALLAVVLVGKGVAALQEAGMMNVTPVAAPRIDLLGIYPSEQTLLAQLSIVVLLAIGVMINLRSQKTIRA